MKLAKAVCVCAVVLMTVVPVAQAEEKLSFIESLKDQPALQKAFNEMHFEVCTCFAYYTIGIHGLEQSNAKAKDIAVYKELQRAMWEVAVMMSRVDTTEARIDLSMKALRDEMHNDMTNFSILLNKYSSLCKEVAEQPEKRIDYWASKAN